MREHLLDPAGEIADVVLGITFPSLLLPRGAPARREPLRFAPFARGDCDRAGRYDQPRRRAQAEQPAASRGERRYQRLAAHFVIPRWNWPVLRSLIGSQYMAPSFTDSSLGEAYRQLTAAQDVLKQLSRHSPDEPLKP